jgi:hypothetical protein
MLVYCCTCFGVQGDHALVGIFRACRMRWCKRGYHICMTQLVSSQHCRPCTLVAAATCHSCHKPWSGLYSCNILFLRAGEQLQKCPKWLQTLLRSMMNWGQVSLLQPQRCKHCKCSA